MGEKKTGKQGKNKNEIRKIPNNTGKIRMKQAKKLIETGKKCGNMKMERKKSNMTEEKKSKWNRKHNKIGETNKSEAGGNV